jgi:uncharacterized protein DUF4124
LSLRATVAAACLACAAGAQAQVYKCVDAKGVTRYSDKPQPDCLGREVDIRGQAPISGQLQKADDLNAAESDFQKRRIEREHAEEAQARAAADRQRRCAQLRTELQRLQYIRRPSDASDLERRLAETSAQIARDCPS